MSNETSKHENVNGHGSYERQDLQVSGILYFLLALIVITVICLFGIRGFYAYLEHYAKGSQPAVNPLITNVPEDRRHVAPGYPQSAFPNPKLEEDERGQLNDIRMNEERELYSYGWVDEKAGTLHIPIERAMDLVAQRGLPVRPQGGAGEVSAATAERRPQESNNSKNVGKGKKK
ncbi:MAG: hypothetical protein JWQ87_3170 [Candidatus Sulfotelmatobacter sp.]|nr:hypothetical protein [Candidatus Sulfotelmatobacter sp.]